MSERAETAEDQGDVVAALVAPGAYPHAPECVVHLQTHISHVFLAGPYVYKLKKAVVFPFLDFRTSAARRRFCEEEVRLNRRLSPEVYLGVVPVTRERDGRLRAGGSGEPVDWLVHMRRLPAERVLTALVRDGLATPAMLEAIANLVARFHATAPAAAGGDPEALRAAWAANLEGVRSFSGRLIAPEDLEVLDDYGRTFVTRHDTVLRARPRLGHVRDGHGDLRTDHVYVLEEPAGEQPGAIPTGIYVVDCVEFSTAFRGIDVAADVSFLAMELEALGRPDLGQAFVGAYAEAAGDPLVPALVPYHACHRAAVRGLVEGLASEEAEVAAADRADAAERARARFALAGRFAWRSGDPVVIATAGLSGSGKSTVAAALSMATGYRVLSSDVLRKEAPLAGEPSYTPAARAQVYARLRDQAERAIAAGESVIVDATFGARTERDRLAHSVGSHGRRWLFVACTAAEHAVRARLAARDQTSVSDARWDVYVAQRAEHDAFGDDEPVVVVDTTGGIEAVRPELVRCLWGWRQGRPIARRAIP